MVTKLHARLQTNGSVFIPGQDFEREVDADGGLWARGWRGGGGIDEEHIWRVDGGGIMAVAVLAAEVARGM